MWLVCAILTFIIWGTADLFYKKSNLEEEADSHLKTSIVVGIVMGMHAIIYYFVNHVSISFMDIIKYLPVSLCYMISMIIGYKGLRYIDLSISELTMFQNNLHSGPDLFSANISTWFPEWHQQHPLHFEVYLWQSGTSFASFSAQVAQMHQGLSFMLHQ